MTDDSFTVYEDYQPGDFDLAIVGMAGRFPGARDLTQFWQNLVNGVESISRFSDAEVLAAGVDPSLSGQPHYVKAGGVLDDAEWFDARFFGFYPREAEVMDPQHRVFLEVAWHALENAGYDPAAYNHAIGVYAGCGMNTYLVYNLAENREIRENVQGYQLTIANDKDFLPTRVAYKLNLRGPAINVQTACSTSLVATHLACQALLNHDCDMALAGGVTIRLPQKGGYLYQEGGIASPDGHCRAFDVDAAGTVGGNGVGIVVMKRLADALADGDTVHAVIKGTAINNDGAHKVGYTAPSVEGQTEVIAAAHAVAGIDPRSLSYIETHGTGTALGDPIEITALTNAFHQGGEPDESQAGQWCAIGSLKPNVGHLDAAAGVAGLIKTTLALENKLIPPSLNYTAPNPKIDFAHSPFYVNAQLSEWHSDGELRRAGVSSFGIGGTNVHVVLEEAPQLQPSGPSRTAQLLVLSAKTEEALDNATGNLAQFLQEHPHTNLADTAYTLKVGRQPFGYRRTAVAGSAAEAVLALKELVGTGPSQALRETTGHGVAFMFTGQGSQYPQMGLGLYRTEPVFREAVDRCADLLRPHMGTDIRGLIYPRPGSPEEAAKRIQQTAVTQPALFVIEYALSRLWLSWGIKPDAMIGHSIGEYVAAHLAGVMTLEDALMIVAARGRLMGSLPSGAMLSLPVSEGEARRLIADYPELTVATINAPEMVVVAGPHEAVDRLEAALGERGVAARRLHTSHAFHSAMMDPILPEFAEVVRRVALQAPTIPYVSNLSGEWITAEEATDPAYYARQLRGAVRFADGLKTMAADADRALVEVGPGRTLASLAKANPHVGRERVVVTSLPRPDEAAGGEDEAAFILGALGQLWAGGVMPTWDDEEGRHGQAWRGFYRSERRRRIPLPLYPFQRERYWVEPSAAMDGDRGGERGGKAAGTARAVKTIDISRWFYAPSWRRIPLPNTAEAKGRRVLVYALDEPAHEAVVQTLSDRTGEPVTVIKPSADFATIPHGFTVKAGVVAEQERLFRQLKENGRLPDAVVHLWSATRGEAGQDAALGFDNLIALVHAWSAAAGSAALQIDVVTRALFDVSGLERTRPDSAVILGAARVIGQEHPNIAVRVIDLQDGEINIPALVNVALAAPREWSVALRGRHGWVQSYEPLETRGEPTRLRQKAVYLITGGLGRIGLVLAAHLARSAQARLVLVDRTGLPPRDKWMRVLTDPDDGAVRTTETALRAKLQQVLALEQAGADVLVVQADVADEAQMAAAVAQALERFGTLHGVIHAAGTVGQAAIRAVSETDAAVREAQLKPKAGGARALQAALQGQELDFVILMSSVATVLGGLGFAAYAGANCFLDAFAVEQARAGLPWLSVAWDGWAFPEEQAFGAAAAGAQAFAITPEEGIAAFERVLSVIDQGAVVVSTGDLAARLAAVRPAIGDAARPDGMQGGATASAATAAPAGVGRNNRPKLRVAYAAATNEVETAIIEDWQSVLGIAPIGVHDDFFELGGHSLLATQLVSRLRDRYHVELPLRNIFETPTAAGLAALILRAQAGADAATAAIEPGASEDALQPAPRDGDLPLSFGQERLWFLDQLSPGSPLYNNFAALRLRASDGGASLDAGRLEWALNQVVARHEVLRTRFGEHDGKPTQTIMPELTLSVPLVDLRGGPRDEVEQRVEALALAEARAPFDLTTGPLLRAKLVQTADDEHVLFFTMHHIVSDGWSVGVLIREVAAHYEQHPAPAQLAALPVQYVDYAAWQRGWLSGERREEQLAYWRKRLTPAPEPLELPTDRPRPAVQTSNGANHWFTVESETYHRLEALAKGEGTTLFMALLAGLQTFLYRYTGQEDICVGTPVANRDRSGTEGLIGFLLNTLVLRTDLSADESGQPPTFRQLLARVRDAALGAYAHQDLPFETLVEALQPARDMSRSPFFQVMFDLQATPLAGLSLPGLSITPLKVDGGTAKFDLALSLEYGPESLGGYLNYNSDLFEVETIARMVEHFGILLQDAVARPDTAISELTIMPAAEEQMLLEDWAVGGWTTWAETDVAESVVAMFEAQVRQRPLQDAVVMAESAGGGTAATLTYGALNERANRMARCLIASGSLRHGNGSDTIIALLLHRTPDMIAAIWAVLKAGAAFLPIDPGNPAERIAFMLRDSGATGVITDRSMDLPHLPEHVHRLDVDGDYGAGQPGDDIGLSICGSDLAYVIYTSGSTGQPKGVLIEHGGLARHIIDVTARFGLQPEDRILQFAAYTFDQGLEQILTALTVGGTLIVRGEEIWPPADFPQVIAEYRLNVINLPPAYWNQVLQEWATSSWNGRLAAVSSLRTVISGGDVLTPESLRLWQATPAARATLINAYGPTETTVTACAFDAPADWFDRQEPSQAAQPTPIGRPLPNRLAYVVDRHGKPTPAGVPGELWLGGNGVARGYLGRPELTAEKFMRNPFIRDARDPWTRLYRTGDLVRYRRDGAGSAVIEFVGRIDQQVKVRGFRIELGEIEATLLEHKNIKQAAVVAQGDGADKRLVAYIVPAGGPAPEARSLRTLLAEKLPAYMTPAAFVLLPALPFNASGKVDHRALLAMAAPELDLSEVTYQAPRTSTEAEIAGVWAEVLRLPRVGVHDNFFDLGGHSLLATQIISRVRARYPVDLPLRRLFEAPTVAGLARLIEDALLAQQDEDELAALLAELDELTDDEANNLLTRGPEAGATFAAEDELTGAGAE